MDGLRYAVPLLVASCWPVLASPAPAQSRLQLQATRKRMVDQAIIGAGVKDRRVIEAMLKTPRHEFVPRHVRKLAYEDMSLPIGDRQTISSPFIVAFMTEALHPRTTDKVLEIGTGSGYQAAVLSHLVRDVYTIEIVPSLGRQARRTLQRLRYGNVHAKVGDGFLGWPEHAPFDKIIVTCSPEKVPEALVQQLREGGVLIVPVGQRYQQTLYILRKKNGKLETEALRPTLFVPMTGAAEQRRQQQPDPLNPKLANGGFEKKPLANGFLPDWYYQRQASWGDEPKTPEGEHCITFENLQPGKPATAMQGFPVDGRKVAYLAVSAWIKYEEIRPGRDKDELPAIVVTFYNENRKMLGYRLVGPFHGTANWHQEKESLRVPTSAREGILRIGLFGAVGKVSFDHVRIRAIRK